MPESRFFSGDDMFWRLFAWKEAKTLKKPEKMSHHGEIVGENAFFSVFLSCVYRRAGSFLREKEKKHNHFYLNLNLNYNKFIFLLEMTNSSCLRSANRRKNAVFLNLSLKLSAMRFLIKKAQKQH